MKKFFSLLLALILMLSLTAFAAEFTFVSSSVKDGAESVYVYEKVITLNFNDNIKIDYVRAPFEAGQAPYYIYVIDGDIAVYENDIKLAEGTDYSLEFDTTQPTSQFTVKFIKPLNYSTSYMIDFSTIKSDTEVELTGTTKTLSFTTEAESEIKLNGIALTNGVSTNVIIEQAQPEDDYTVADTRTLTKNSINGFNVSLSNSSSSEKTVTILCAVYDRYNFIKRVLTAEKAIDAASTDSVELGTFIDSSLAGGKATIYIWDNLSNKSPFVGSKTFNINN